MKSWTKMRPPAACTESVIARQAACPRVERSDTAALAVHDDEDDSAIPIAAGKSQWTVRVSARSKVTPGRPMKLGVDTSNLHFFDPGSGLAIT